MNSELQKQGGYIVLSAQGMKTTKVRVETADQASSIWWDFVRANLLGVSKLKRDSGLIYSDAGVLVARVSYNGRVWTPDGNTLLQDYA